jgi:hypothetical protein
MRYSALPIVLAGLAAAGAAQANSLTTFVSGTGVDSGACTAAAPCRTLQFAFARTKFDGVVTVVSSGSFGAVNITRSVSIVADGVTALIQSSTACGGIAAAICISATGEVTLRGLTIDLHQTGSSNLSGIRFISGGALHVQNCLIRGAGASGIDFEPTSPPSSLFVSDTTLTDNQASGIDVDLHVNGNANATFDHVRAENNAVVGLLFENTLGALNGVVTNSVFAGNGSAGVAVAGTGGAGVNLTIDYTMIATNGLRGVSVFANSGIAAIARIGDSTIAGNATGVQIFNFGQILSFGTNKLVANGTDGSFTGTVLLQ